MLASLGRMDVAGDDRVDVGPRELAHGRGAKAVAIPGERRLAVAASARRGRAVGEPMAGAGRQQAEREDRDGVPEHGAYGPISALRPAEGVAVREEEREVVVARQVRVLEDLDAELALEPSRAAPGAHPVVVVAAHEGHGDVARPRPLESAQDGAVLSRRFRVVEPEIEHVAEEIERRTGVESIEERDQVTLLRGLDGG